MAEQLDVNDMKAEIDDEVNGLQASEGEERSLEERFSEIETILSKLEDGNTSLEEAFGLYKKGIKEVQAANTMLDQMEKEMLVLNKEGTLEAF